MKARPGAAVRPRRDSFERRKAIIVRAATEIMIRKGVRGMMLADVAARLHVVPTAVNYYFRRKEDLAAACFLRAIAHFNELLDRSETETTAEARLRRLLHEFAAHLEEVDNGTAEPIVTFDDVRTIGDPTVDAAFISMFRRVRRIFGVQLPGDHARSLRNAYTHLLISQVLWTGLWLRRYEPADYRRMVDRLYDILVNGLMTRTSVWAPIKLPFESDPGDVHERRAAFLRAATEMINDHGYLGASVSRISARLNLTKGSFYHHHGGKDELVEQCFDRTLKISLRSQVAAEVATENGFAALASFAASTVRSSVSGEVPLLRLSALTAVPETLRTQLVDRFDRVANHLASIISDGIADGSIRPVDATVAAQMIAGLINASTELSHWAPDLAASGDIEALARPLFTGLFRLERSAEPREEPPPPEASPPTCAGKPRRRADPASGNRSSSA